MVRIRVVSVGCGLLFWLCMCVLSLCVGWFDYWGFWFECLTCLWRYVVE